MSVRSEVLLWAQRIVAKKGVKAHQLLEIAPEANLEEAQAAFHKIARASHPDLHRTTLDETELELVTLAYSRIAGAYQDFRSQRMQTARLKPVGDAEPAAGTEPAPPPSGVGAANTMSSKALVYYRKAELALRRGDLRGAVLQLKLAIASDPQSQFLRSALGEVEAELGK